MTYTPLYGYDREFRYGLKAEAFGKRVAEMNKYELIAFIGLLLIKVEGEPNEPKPEEGLHR